MQDTIHVAVLQFFQRWLPGINSLFLQNNVLSLCLCDTNTSKDIHINDTLVDQGLAIFTPDTDLDCQDHDGFQLEGAPVQVCGGRVK